MMICKMTLEKGVIFVDFFCKKLCENGLRKIDLLTIMGTEFIVCLKKSDFTEGPFDAEDKNKS